MNDKTDNESIPEMMNAAGEAAVAAAAALTRSSTEQRNDALSAAAAAILEGRDEILDANIKDMDQARERGLPSSMLDRLMLDESRVVAISKGLDVVADLPDPLGKVLASWERPNGLIISRVSVPLGVIGIIYESRPNVTADAAALCLKSGNAVILRGGSESFHSSRAIHKFIVAGLVSAGITRAAVQMVPTTDRAAVGYLLSSMANYLDVVVPRGGRSLIQRVQEEARVPVIGHLEGICHVYLHESANTQMAGDIAVNAKMRRTGICGAAESMLVDRGAAERLLPPVCARLIDAGCQIRGDAIVQKLVPDVTPATEDDWSTEYLDAILSVRVVDDIDVAMAHIQRYGSGHTECIVTEDHDAAKIFLDSVDSAILLHNASTQFADGGEFGMGAEIGIATDRIHARGPVGAEQLTS
ncbi:MAG: glutamate-5-semialdehyde dehydrogenase [Woeseiaceae bacterium]